ncbi:MAG: macro domain-containing protein [Tissierellia bacterium]|nr:macro domain-containing protein [Tissierellia bacterium]
MPLTILRQDITQMQVDAIVNAANVQLKAGGGVCGAIFRAAGALQLQNACDPLSPIRTGEAVMTPGFHLPAKAVIHTAGPIYKDGKQGEEALLRASYRNSLQLALDQGFESIAFPLISSGIYGYPKKEALMVAADEIRLFLETEELDVYLTVFDKTAFTISDELMGGISSYIDANYKGLINEESEERSIRIVQDNLEYASYEQQSKVPPIQDKRLEDWLNNLDESFSDTLLRWIDAKGLSDIEVYKRANIDRKLFSKIRRGQGYNPSKRTAIALAIALKLNLEETNALLEKAGYALSPSQLFDVIVECFILNEIYDIFEINAVLFRYDQPVFGSI